MKHKEKISLKQKLNEILYLLYRFRFLTRLQIQILLKHKNHKRILLWLNELTKKKYIRKQYNEHTPSVPAVYSLGIASRKYLKDSSEFKDISPHLLDRIWREDKVSKEFQKCCLFIADIYISLLSLTEKTKAILHFSAKTDLYGIKHLIYPIPDAYIAIEEKKGVVKRYFLDILDKPEKIYQRVGQYLNYHEDEIWQANTKKEFPGIILICQNERYFNQLYRHIQKKLEEEQGIHFYLSTWERIQTQGINKTTLQKIEIKE